MIANTDAHTHGLVCIAEHADWSITTQTILNTISLPASNVMWEAY